MTDERLAELEDKIKHGPGPLDFEESMELLEELKRLRKENNTLRELIDAGISAAIKATRGIRSVQNIHTA